MQDYTFYISGIRIHFNSRFKYRVFNKYMSPAATVGYSESNTSDIIDIDFDSINSIAQSYKEYCSEKQSEFLAALRQISERTPYFDTIFFHGSALMVDGNAYIFTAPSGTGKSTHSRLWREEFGERVTMVNDDKPMLQVRDGRVFVCGTPWNGKHALGCNIVVPVKAICFLERAETNSIVPAEESCILPKLLPQFYRPFDPVALSKTFDVLDVVRDKVKFYTLRCNMEPEAAHVAYDALVND